MQIEKSAGVIVFRKHQGKIFYLLLRDGLGYWGFSKGHVDPEEKIEETALRELVEETGIEKVYLQPGFKKWIRYIFQRKSQKIFKQVCFFLGETKTSQVVLSSEHTDFRWFLYEEAQKQLSFKNTKLLLKKAQRFLDFSY